MDTQTFLDNFATIADAPGGIERLRSLILDLAVRGQLVEQRSEEEGITKALEAKRSETGPVVKAKVPGRPKVPRVPEEWEQRHAAPPGWEWARIDDTGSYVNGLAFNQHTWTNEGTPIIRIQNLTNPSAEFNYAEGPFPDDRMVDDGDILVSWSATLEAFVWDRGPAVVNQHIFKVIPDDRIVDSNFLFHLLRSSIRILADGEAAHGLVMKHINRGPFVSHPVAIPPLAEQQRIVAKVDELMAFCDELEEAQQQREHTAALARTSALHALTTAASDADRAAAWGRIADKWLSLTDSPDGSARLRQVILQLGVAGHLVPQHTEDEPADTAMNRAIAELSQMPPVRGRKASGAQLDGDVALFVGKPSVLALREGWTVAALSDVTRLESGHTPDRKVPEYWDGPHPWISISDARAHRGGSIGRTAATVSDAGISNSATRMLPEGTVCLSRTASVGYSVITEVPMCTSQDFVNFICTDALEPRYLQLIFLAEEHALKRFSKGAVHQTIYFPEVKAFHILLPPRAEQERIVAKVDELLRLCDDLARAQRESQDSASSLADAFRRGRHVA